MHHLLPRSLLSFILLTLPCLATAQTTLPNAFTDGTPALASEVNANFDALTSGLNTLENGFLGYDDLFFNYKTIAVDCTTNADAFIETFTETLHLDRLRLELTGECTAGEFGFSVGHRDLFITGGVNEERECLGGASLISGPYEGANRVDIGVNNGGVLWLECLTLGDSADTVSLAAYANAYIRIQSGVTTGSGDGYDILLRDNSLFRTFYWETSINTITLRNNSTAHVQGTENIGIQSVVADNGSVFVCRYCSGAMSSLTLKYGSMARFENTYNASLEIGALSATAQSSVYISDDSSPNAPFFTESFESPLLNDSNFPNYNGNYVTFGVATPGFDTGSDAPVGTSFVGNSGLEWTVPLGNIDLVGAALFQAAEGSQSVNLNGFEQGAIAASVNFPTPGMYMLSFALSKNPTGVDEAQVEVSVDGLALTGSPFIFNDPVTAESMNYRQVNVSFRVASAGIHTLNFKSLNAGSPNGYGPVIDNISISLDPGLVNFAEETLEYDSNVYRNL